MTYVYFLRLSNGDIYKGLTDDLPRRLREHEKGSNVSTSLYQPLALLGYEAYKSKSDAIRREKFLKTTEGMRLLKRQYRDIISASNLMLEAPSCDGANSRIKLTMPIAS